MEANISLFSSAAYIAVYVVIVFMELPFLAVTAKIQWSSEVCPHSFVNFCFFLSFIVFVDFVDVQLLA